MLLLPPSACVLLPAPLLVAQALPRILQLGPFDTGGGASARSALHPTAGISDAGGAGKAAFAGCGECSSRAYTDAVPICGMVVIGGVVVDVVYHIGAQLLQIDGASRKEFMPLELVLFIHGGHDRD